MKIVTQSTITCPVCNNQETFEMPEDSCQFFYESPKSNRLIRLFGSTLSLIPPNVKVAAPVFLFVVERLFP